MDEMDKLLTEYEINLEGLKAVEKIIIKIKPTETLEKIKAIKEQRAMTKTRETNSGPPID